MPEEKQEKKKSSIIKRVFKWLGLGILAILLIAALIFQAPWKITTLLVIILAACTALPKPAIKWFWLSVAAIVIALIIWVFLPEENGDWRPYTFDQELAALQAKYAVPNSENAATIYNKLFEDYDPNDFEPNLPDPNAYDVARTQPWSSQDYPELAQWLKGHQSTIAKLIEASKIEKCRFPIPGDYVAFGQSMKRLSAIRRWARLLVIAANNDIAEDRISEALQKNVALLQMAKHQCQQPLLMEMLVGIAIEALATQQFNSFVVIGDATEQRLNVIESALANVKHNWSADLPRFLEGEKLWDKNLWGHYYEVNPKGKIRFSRDPMARLRAQYPEEFSSPTYWKRKLTKAGAILAWFLIPSTPQKAAKIIDASYEKLYAMAQPNFDWKKEPKERKFSVISIKFNYLYLIELLTDISEPVYYKIHDLYLRVTADRRGSQLLIALRRYKNKTGRWPESLDEIKSLAPAEIFVDPINDDSFVYKLTDDTFKLYSKGKNNIDEDGKYKDGADDWLIWPKKTCKTKEKDANGQQQ